MYKGDISNLFADTIILDVNLIYQPTAETLLDKALTLLNKPRFKLVYPYIPRYLETLFYNGYSIYLLDRNKVRHRPERLFYGMCYSDYIRTENLEEIRALFELKRVVIGFVDRDVSALSYHSRKCWNFINWQDAMDKIRNV